MNLFNSNTVQIERDSDGTAMVILDHKGELGNRVNLSLVRDLSAGLDVLSNQQGIPVVILRSGKKSGFAFGPDLEEWLSLQTPGEIQSWEREGINLIRKLSNLPMPTIAAIHGPCLGAGLELALACDYLLAFDRPDTVLALSEVDLGACPPWGSLFWLVRRIGLERTARLAVFGEKWKVATALRHGLIDLAASNEQSLRAAHSKLIGIALRDGKRLESYHGKRSWKRMILENNPLGRYLLLRGLKRFMEKRAKGQNPGGVKTLELLKSLFLETGFDSAAEKIADLFPQLAASPECRNSLSMVRQDIDRLPAVRIGATIPQRVLLAGGGNPLAQWAFLHLSKGFAVNLHCETPATLGIVLFSLEKLIRETVRKGIWTAQVAQKRLAMVEGFTQGNASNAAQLALIFPPEGQDISFLAKFQECSPECPLVRGGEISPSDAGQWQARLTQQLPLGKFPCCEVEFQPSAREFEKEMMLAWLGKLGKQVILTANSPVAVGNRLFFRGLVECLEAIAEGVAPDALELALRNWGFIHGPLFWADWLGNSRVHDLGKSLPDVPPEILEVLDDLGSRKWEGVAQGKGWFLHRKASWWMNPLARNLAIYRLKRTVDPVTKALNKKRRVQDARDRVVLAMLIETARLTGLKVIPKGKDWDYFWVRGLGWPARLGGPVAWVKSQGEANWKTQAAQFQTRLGQRFQLPPEWDLFFSQSAEF